MNHNICEGNNTFYKLVLKFPNLLHLFHLKRELMSIFRAAIGVWLSPKIKNFDSKHHSIQQKPQKCENYFIIPKKRNNNETKSTETQKIIFSLYKSSK